MLGGATTERCVALLCALLLTALAALALAASPVSGGRPDGGRAHADLDGDAVFDDLEARLAGSGADERVHVLVRLREPATRARVAALAEGLGSLDVERRFTIVPAFEARATKRQVEALARHPAVAHVEPVVAVRGLNDDAQASSGVAKARLDAPWLDGDRDGNPAAYSTTDVVVAVVDSGIDAKHPDLDGGKVLRFVDFVKEPPLTEAYDDNGHGTHVAGIIAGTGEGNSLYRGVAPGAAIVAVKVLDGTLHGNSADVMAGIEWVEKNQATYNIRVVNLSLEAGGVGCSGPDALTDAVNRIAAKGVLVTAAAGNFGPGPCSIPNPAAADGALTVGSVADTGEGGFRLARSSSRGPTSDGRIKPDLVAPGVAITSTAPTLSSALPAYDVKSGTSMAAPFVAGIAALMIDANAALGGAHLKTLLMQTAVDWGRGGDNVDPGGRGVDVDYGAGRVDAYAALAAAAAPLTSPPPVPVHDLRHGGLPATGSYADHAIAVSGTGFPLAVTAIAPGASGLDVDLTLFDPSGAQVAASAESGRQEDVSVQPATTGTYTLRVSSRSGAGFYFLDVSGAVTSPPVNEAPPTITGVVREGQALAADAGRWSGGTPLSFAYQWVRCDGGGNGCVGIAGATASTYAPGAGDIGSTLRIAVTGSNAAGSATALAPATAPVAALPPANTAAPVVSGRADVGNTLTALPGEWRSSPAVTFAYQWRRCTAAGSACAPIAGATGASYRLRALDAGSRVGVVVTASNAGGSSSAASATPLVEARAPQPTAKPRISGSVRIGRRLRASRGHWRATPPLRYGWRWSRCDRYGRRCRPIRGARTQTYVARPADLGHRLRVRVFADNRALAGGAIASAVSRATPIVRR